MTSRILAFPEPTGDPACRTTLELLPWLLAGTLDREEEARVRAHLASCASCREELAATRQAAAIFSAHLPVEALARLSVGLEVEGIDDATVRSHLSACAQCSAELAAARGPGVGDISVRRRSARGPRRVWALVGAVAAAVVALVVIPRVDFDLGGPTSSATVATAEDASLLFSNDFESPSLAGWSRVESRGASAAN